MKIIEYQTLFDEFLFQLDAEINELLKNGWELYGSLYTASIGEYNYICQAMVKYGH